MSKRRLWWIIGLVAAAGLGVWFWRSGTLGAVEEVDAAHVRRGTLQITLPVTGVFETRSVNLSFETPGRLLRVAAGEGQFVRRGTVLASLDDADLIAMAAQAEAAASAARSEAARARAAVESARQQAVQAAAAYRAVQAQLAQLRAGARTPELQQADAAVEAARSARDQARRNLTVQEQLFRDGAIARAQLDAARAQYESAEAAYRQAVAQRDALRAGPRPEAIIIATEQVRQAEAGWRAAQANVRQAQALAAAGAANASQAQAGAQAARIRASRAHLRAPFDGFVGRVFLSAGAPVGPGVPVVSLVSASGWVTADVDESDVGGIRTGQVARITADAYPGRTLSGRVTDIGRQVDLKLGTRTVRVRIELDAAAQMRAGTSVDVDLILQTVRDALLVPLEAVIGEDNGGTHVFVIAGGALRRREVQAGPRNDLFVVIERGLAEDELVAIGEPARLRDGLRVRARLVR